MDVLCVPRNQMARFLPPLGPLRHFEVAARLGSFKQAAQELDVTAGAVSQQVAELERFLKVRLFNRHNRRLSLTDEGRRLAESVRSALTEISTTSLEVSGRAQRTAVRVEVGPFLSARWLAPRLIRFSRQHPEVKVQLLHAAGARIVDCDADIAIRWGDGQWPGCKAEKLLEVDLQPVAAPSIAAGLRRHRDVSAYPLVHSLDRGAWLEWLGATRLSTEIARTGIVFDEPNVAVETIVAGAGVGIGYFPMMEEEIRAGRLICALPPRIRCSSAYYLINPPASRRLPLVQLFADWLRSEAREMARKQPDQTSPPQQPAASA
jgi:LysR family transcriptional regulator, glycine cleavage system transcriptional activator